MAVQDGDWRAGLKGTGRLISSGARDLATGLVDLLLPPMAHDSREATASMGLSPDFWSRIVFLEDPVCDGCSAPFDIEEAAFEPFAALFARWVGRAAAPLLAEADVIVPVPLHRSRLLARRFNQAAEIARPMARQARLDYLPDALVRVSATATQGGKSARGRRLNVKKAFAVSEAGRRRIKGRRILLIDDVFTTGATAEACARALMAAGARAVDLAVVARVRTARDLPK